LSHVCRKGLGRFRPENNADNMNATEVQSLIEAGLPGAQVRVSSPDDTHFEAVIVAPQFEGKRTLQRHQLVYGTLGARMGREIHALSMQVLSPQEASSDG
jgi:acid stress-induced BolA-like protein IbaG/YrbA